MAGNPGHSGGTQSTTNTLLSGVTTTKVTSTFPNGSVTIKVKTILATTQTGAIRPSSTSTSALGTSSTSGSVNSSSTTSSSPAGSQSKTPASPSTSKGSSDTGAIVGAAVGCLIGGALLAFLAAWFFFKRRNKRDQLNRQSSSYRGRDHRSPARKPVPTVAAAGIHEKSSSTSGDSGSSWQAYLPQSVDDQTIRRDVKTLFDQIDLHVDNYYTKANVRIDSGTSRALAEYNDENLPDSIEALIANPQTSLPTIKHCIARMLVTRMSPGYDRASLLPEYLAAPQTKLNSSMSPGERIAAQQAYSQWRVLNAYLHPRTDQNRHYQQRREAAADEISSDLSDTFASWQGPQENIEGLKQHERSLVMRASDVATLIMSQPSAYEFWWSASSQTFIVYPGFLKTTDERGRSLDQPQTLIQPVMAR